MTTEQRLKKVVGSIDDVVAILRRSNAANDPEVRRAITELEDAHSQVKRAIREIRVG